ncbi:MAG TPA: hypothetical protein VKE26_26225 [Xanthobacteraceae bacterium]|nr:hypothetical protein [Xanthobacteraceae bacterium]
MGGQYDEWLSREPDPGRDRLRLKPETLWHCHDCGEDILRGAVSVMTDDGASRIYCRSCGESRRAQGWLFDSRSLAVLRQTA